MGKRLIRRKKGDRFARRGKDGKERPVKSGFAQTRGEHLSTIANTGLARRFAALIGTLCGV